MPIKNPWIQSLLWKTCYRFFNIDRKSLSDVTDMGARGSQFAHFQLQLSVTGRCRWISLMLLPRYDPKVNEILIIHPNRHISEIKLIQFLKIIEITYLDSVCISFLINWSAVSIRHFSSFIFCTQWIILRIPLLILIFNDTGCAFNWIKYML